MPDSNNLDPSVVVAGANLLGQAFNAVSTGKTNKKTRKWNEMMYNRQRYDARQQWQMQNEYNSPQQQMERLKQAGLNPNLVYGSGQAQQPASSIDSASAPTWSPRAPSVEIAPAISSHFDTRLKQAQYDNLKAQNTVLTNEALLKTAQIAATIQGTAKTKISTDLAAQTYGNTIELINEQVRQMQSKSAILKIDSNYHEGIRSAEYDQKRGQAEKIWQDMEEQKLRMRGMSKSQILQEFEIKLRKIGVNPNDPTWLRMIGQIISDKVNLSSLKF